MSVPAKHVPPAPPARRRFLESPLGRFLKRCWDVVNFLRRLVFNAIFLFFLLIFLILVLAGIFGGSSMKSDTTLVLNPKGKVVEQFTQDPFSSALTKMAGDDSSEVRLRDLLQVLDRVKDDKRINRVVLDLDKLTPTGWASTREIAQAVRAVRDSGKEVITYTEGFEQSQYLIAAAGNQVYVDPLNGVMLMGLSRYRQYYRELLQDKLGVDMQLFKVGTFKSAAEPYILDASSPAAKEADMFWMNDMWTRYMADVAKDRKTTPDALNASILNQTSITDGDLAKYALASKWVDGLKTRAEFNDMIAKKGVKDDSNDLGYRAIGYQNYLDTISMEPNKSQPLMATSNVGVIIAEGEIAGGEKPAGTIGGDSTSKLLREALKDKSIKAVVLRVNSPGGEVFASEQIRREVNALKKAGKPVVASMGDLAASGGYWISMDANRIYADPSTITGSIGIFGLIPNVTRGLDKIGVHTDGVQTTPFAGAFDPTRPMAPEVKGLIQGVIEKGYRDFAGNVAKARGKTYEQIDEIAQGRVWTGAQAKERGLVDEFGTLNDAITYAASLAKLGDVGSYGQKYIEEKATPFSELFGKVPRVKAFIAGNSFLRSFFVEASPQMVKEFDVLRKLSSKPSGQVITPVAHCLCQ